MNNNGIKIQSINELVFDKSIPEIITIVIQNVVHSTPDQ